MKTTRHNCKSGFTSLDLFFCIVAVVGCIAVIFPMFYRGPRRSPRIACINNLKQVAVGFRLYANDNENAAYPILDITNGAWAAFQTVGKEIGSPKVLICPADVKRDSALDFETNASPRSFSSSTNCNHALSYFYGGTGDESKPGALLAGDRNLQLSGLVLRNYLVLTTNSSAEWTSDLHTNVGNVALMDGSVQLVSNAKIPQLLRFEYSGVVTQTLVLPNQ